MRSSKTRELIVSLIEKQWMSKHAAFDFSRFGPKQRKRSVALIKRHKGCAQRQALFRPEEAPGRIWLPLKEMRVFLELLEGMRRGNEIGREDSVA